MKKILMTLFLSVSLLVFSASIFAENENGHMHMGVICTPECPMFGRLTEPDNDAGESIFERLVFEIGKIFVF
jgi:hypothetical protein